MYKLKTNQAAKKRIHITSHNFYYKSANNAHLLRKKSKSRKRDLNKLHIIKNADLKNWKALIPYSL